MAILESRIKIDTGFLIKVVRGVTASPEFNETTSDDYKKGFFDFAEVLINTLEKISESGTAEEARCDSCKGMTPQEAIRRIKNHNEVHSRKEKHFAVHITEALNMAVEALEKQIPKKPILKETKCFDGSTDDFVFVCPVCNRTICIEPEDDVIADYIKEEYPHCHCGQALDWSNTE